MERVMGDDESAASSGARLAVAQSSFGRDFTSSVHLYFTHWMWTGILGFDLHPSIPRNKDLAIACVNDSTGIWSIDLANRNPNFRCDTFDLSAEQFPPSAWLPKNCNLSVLDFTRSLPVELRGQYDVVRCPMMTTQVRKGDYMRLIDNLLLFLKPGGYFQWEEADVCSTRAVPCRPDLPTGELDNMVAKIIGALQHNAGSDLKWAGELEKHSRSRNLIVLDNQRYEIPDHLAHPWTLQHLMAMMGMIQNLEEDSEMAGEWLDTYDRAAIGVMQGVSVRMDVVVCVSQVPPGRVSKSEALKGR